MLKVFLSSFNFFNPNTTPDDNGAPMDSLEQYDHFFNNLRVRIALEPEKKKTILLQAIRETNCPYLKKMIRTLVNSCVHP